MFTPLKDCTITDSRRYYRTDKNRPNLEKLAFDLRTSTSLKETVDSARRLLNALNVDSVIKEHENLISRCMELIKMDTYQGAIITKNHMAYYLLTVHNVNSGRDPHNHECGLAPFGATEVALERLTEQGYLRRVKVRHKTDSLYGSSKLEAYQVI